MIWYRASEACPSGAEFTSGIRVDGRTARLAAAGDHVDYVVTLDSDGKKSSGRLERQTARGTIAISELRGGPCGEVAEALGLSLALAVTPRRSEPAPTAPPEAGIPPKSGPTGDEMHGIARVLPERPGLIPGVEVRADPATGKDAPGSSAPGSDPGPRLPRFWLGGGLSGTLGMTPSPSVGGQLFVEYEWAGFSSRRPTSFRVGPGVSYSRTSIDGLGPVEQWVTALELTLCPLRLSTGAIGVAPCVAGVGGVFVARSKRDTSRTSANLWLALGPALRGSAAVSSRVTVGLTAAVTASFSRLDVAAGSELLYRTPPAVFSLGADLLWAVP